MATQHLRETEIVLARVDRTGRVRRRVQYEPACGRRDCALQHFGRDLELCLCRARYDNRFRAGIENAVRIGDPEGRRDDSLVARLHGRDDGIEDGLLAARRDHDLVGRVFDAVLALQLGGERGPQFQRTGNGGVLGLAAFGRRGSRLDDMGGRREIRLASREGNDIAALSPELARPLRGNDARRWLDTLKALGDLEFHGVSPDLLLGGAHIPRRGPRAQWRLSLYPWDRDASPRPRPGCRSYRRVH